MWKSKFKDQAAVQRKMALALGVSQQTVSNLLGATYKPGLRVAEGIATLDGKNALEELIGAYGRSERDLSIEWHDSFANLTVRIQFFASSKHWSPWTIAAARAGFFRLGGLRLA